MIPTKAVRRTMLGIGRLLNAFRKWTTWVILCLFVSFTVATHTISFLSDMIATAVHAVSGVNTTSRQLRQSGATTSTEIADVRARLDANETDLARVRSERDLARSDLAGARQEVRSLRQQGAELAAQNRTLRVEASAHSARAARLHHENLQIRNSNLIIFQGRRITIREASSRVVASVQTRTRRTATANLGAIFGESIPFYGIAIAVSATTFELTMACNTMNDLYDLQVAIDPESAVAEDRNEVCGLQVPSAEEIWAAIKVSPRAVWDGAVAVVQATPGWVAELPSPDFASRWNALVDWWNSD